MQKKIRNLHKLRSITIKDYIKHLQTKQKTLFKGKCEVKIVANNKEISKGRLVQYLDRILEKGVVSGRVEKIINLERSSILGKCCECERLRVQDCGKHDFVQQTNYEEIKEKKRRKKKAEVVENAGDDKPITFINLRHCGQKVPSNLVIEEYHSYLVYSEIEYRIVDELKTKIKKKGRAGTIHKLKNEEFLFKFDALKEIEDYLERVYGISELCKHNVRGEVSIERIESVYKSMEGRCELLSKTIEVLARQDVADLDDHMPTCTSEEGHDWYRAASFELGEGGLRLTHLCRECYLQRDCYVGTKNRDTGWRYRRWLS